MREGLYLHLRKFVIVDERTGTTSEQTVLEAMTEAATKAHLFFKRLEQEAIGAQLVLEATKAKLAMARGVKAEGFIGARDDVEDAFRRLSLVMTAYALFKATLGDIPRDLASVNLTGKDILEGELASSRKGG